MTVFTFTVTYDQQIRYQFDQDDIKSIGTQRVQSESVVVAPDRELAELYLRRSLRYANLVIDDVKDVPVNLFVDASGRTLLPMREGRAVGPEQIEPHWQERLKRERYAW